jgi:hypothetical protein
MNALTVAGQTPVTGKCAIGDDMCLTITITCAKETDAAQKLVFCKEATTTTAYY